MRIFVQTKEGLYVLVSNIENDMVEIEKGRIPQSLWNKIAHRLMGIALDNGATSANRNNRKVLKIFFDPEKREQVLNAIKEIEIVLP